MVMTALPCAPVLTAVGASEPPDEDGDECLSAALRSRGGGRAATSRAVINPYRNVLRMEILLTVNWAFTQADEDHTPFPAAEQRFRGPGQACWWRASTR